MIDKLMVFYPSAMDHRRIDQEHTPYLHSLTQIYPWPRIKNFPEVDLDPTIFTGLYPHEHGIWQLRINSGYNFDKIYTQDYLPDIITTTSQCLIHLYTGSYNLAAVPNWRRRRFEIMKTRYDNKVVSEYIKLNGFDTFFNIIGGSNCNYIYRTNLYNSDQITPELFSKNLRLELIETHWLDTISHWYVDDKQKMIYAYNKIDKLIEYLHLECKSKGITLMIISDHGMEQVLNTIDIKKKINEMGIQNNEITYYIEASKARFWFHTDSAREKMLDYLSGNSEGVLLSYQDMSRFNLKFEDDRYGEYYFILNPGIIFFPNDYYHPIANIYLGLTNRRSRSRLFNPKHRGYHGYLPHNDSEKGTLMLLHDDYNTEKQEIDTIDVAPTILDLLGYEQPDSFKGASVFQSC